MNERIEFQISRLPTFQIQEPERCAIEALLALSSSHSYFKRQNVNSNGKEGGQSAHIEDDYGFGCNSAAEHAFLSAGNANEYQIISSDIISKGRKKDLGVATDVLRLGLKAPSRRRRVDHRTRKEQPDAWSQVNPTAGYIKHPDAGWIIHPSMFERDYKLCKYCASCPHKRSCTNLRLEQALTLYKNNKDVLSMRDIEILWGVSRSTVSRAVRNTPKSNFI